MQYIRLIKLNLIFKKKPWFGISFWIKYILLGGICLGNSSVVSAPKSKCEAISANVLIKGNIVAKEAVLGPDTS